MACKVGWHLPQTEALAAGGVVAAILAWGAVQDGVPIWVGLACRGRALPRALYLKKRGAQALVEACWLVPLRVQARGAPLFLLCNQCLWLFRPLRQKCWLVQGRSLLRRVPQLHSHPSQYSYNMRRSVEG